MSRTQSLGQSLPGPFQGCVCGEQPWNMREQLSLQQRACKFMDPWLSVLQPWLRPTVCTASIWTRWVLLLGLGDKGNLTVLMLIAVPRETKSFVSSSGGSWLLSATLGQAGLLSCEQNKIKSQICPYLTSPNDESLHLIAELSQRKTTRFKGPAYDDGIQHWTL